MPILLIRANTNALRAFPLRAVSYLRASQCYATLRHRNIRARRIVYLSLHRKWAGYFARNARLPRDCVRD